MIEDDDLIEGRHYQGRFFARLAQLAAPYSVVLFVIHKAAFCSPRPRLSAVLANRAGVDFQFKAASCRLMNVRGLGLPRTMKRLLSPAGFVPAPVLNPTDEPEAAAEFCWAYVMEVAKPRLVASDELPALNPAEEMAANWASRWLLEATSAEPPSGQVTRLGQQTRIAKEGPHAEASSVTKVADDVKRKLAAARVWTSHR